MNEQQTTRQQSLFRRLTALALSLIMVLTMLPTPALAAAVPPTSGQCGENLTWKYDETTQELTISGTGDMWNYDDYGYEGEELQPTPWLSHKEALTAITIQDGVTSIGQGSFEECYALTTVTIPASVTSLGNSAFNSCFDLVEVYISDLAKWCQIDVGGYSNPLYNGASLYCNDQLVEHLVIPTGIKEVKPYTFNGCSSLQSVTIPNAVTTIGEGAFLNCLSMTSVTIQEGITTIGDYAFSDCSNLTSVTIPEGVTTIGESAFFSCYSLETVTIPASMTSIGMEAFASCGNLQTVHISDLAKWCQINMRGLSNPMYNGASLYCNDQLVENLVIPAGTKKIKPYIFNGCSSLRSITIPNTVETIGQYAFAGCSNLQSATIPSNVTAIDDGAFSECTNLKSITLPNSITELPWYLFSGCTSLERVTIPSNVTTIGMEAFSDCTSLKSITIPDSVTEIVGFAFMHCTSLQDIALPDGITYIGCRAFSDTAWYNVQPDGLLYLHDYLLGYKGSAPSGALKIKAGTRAIAGSAFEYCEGLTKVTIPSGVSAIGSEAFAGCSNLKNITLPDSVRVIYGAAFSYSGLESIHLSKELLSFEGCHEAGTPGVFDHCANLKKVYVDSLDHWLTITYSLTRDNPLSNGAALYCDGKLVEHLVIPETQSEINGGAFYGCTSLKSVTCHPHVGKINNYAFDRCVNLEKISLGDEIDYIGEYAFRNTKWYNAQNDGPLYLHTYLLGYKNQQPSGHLEIKSGTTVIAAEALQECSALIGVTIPESVIYINSHAFSSCTGLTSVTIPDNVWTLGHHAFYGCTNLQDIHLGRDVHSLDQTTFADTAWYNAQGDGPLYLDGCLLGYKGSEPAGQLQVAPGTRAIAFSAFKNCSDLTAVSLPDSLLIIGSDAFAHTNLTTVTIPDSVTHVGRDTFAGCAALRDIRMGKGVTYIHRDTFADTAWYEAQSDGLLYLGDCLLGYKGVAPTGALAPNSGTRVVAGYAFDGCTGLTSITFPETMKHLDTAAFYRCTGLKKILFTGKAPECSNSAFDGVTAVAYYPANDPTWTQEIRDDYPGSLTWVPYGDATQELTAPTLTANIAADSGYPHLEWTSVSGAESYEIWGAPANEKMTLLATIKDTAYTYTKAVPGREYIYKVRAITTEKKGPFSNADTVIGLLSAPELLSVELNENNKPVLKWTSVNGAVKYRVDCVHNGAAPTTLATVDGTQFIHADAQPGDNYRYLVSACGQDGGDSGMSNDILIAIPEKPVLPAPQLTVTNTASTGKPYLEWNSVDGADKYEIYYSTSKDGSYVPFYTSTKNSVKHGSAERTVTYYYKIRAVAPDGTKSDWSSVQTRTCDLARPNVQASTRSDGKPMLTWAAVPEAQKYLVYYRVDGGSFEKLTTVSGTKLTHSSAKTGHTYTYKVRALASKSAANSAWSYYDTITVEGLSAPTLTVTNTSSTGKPYLKWTAVDGADKYEVYYSTSKNGTYKRLFTASGTTLKHGSAKAGTSYYYKVRAITNGGVKGEFSPYKLRTCDLARPDVKLSTRNGHPYLDWKSISGAVKYDVYCSVDGGSFQRLIGVKSSHLTHSSAKSGHTYRYRVKAIASKSSANSAYSYYDTITVK